MEHPLENYRKLANISFIRSMDFEFYTRHFNTLNQGLTAVINKTKEGIHVNGFDIETGEFEGFTTIYTFFEQEYNKLENEARSMIDKVILQHLDDKKQETFIKTMITELQFMQNAVSIFELDGTSSKLKFILLEKSKSFSKMLAMVYLSNTGIPSNTVGFNKIQWLGDIKMLTTLFYELWHGQDKGKNMPSLKSIIKAEKQDIAAMLENHFVNAKGQPLKASTMSDYLNVSKPRERSKEGVRIELDY